MKASAPDHSAAPEISYSFGLYLLDPANGTLTRDSVRVRLQEQPFRLLLLLVERAGQIVSREEIRNRLWPQNTFVEFDKSLGVAVLKVREALGDDASNPRFIETIPRRGYRFIAPVKVETPHACGFPRSDSCGTECNGVPTQSVRDKARVDYRRSRIVVGWHGVLCSPPEAWGLTLPQPRPGPQSLEYTCVVRSQCSASAICLVGQRTIGSLPLSAKC